MAQRKRKQSRRQAEARRRWMDLQETKRKKYAGPWKRRDRRREAFQQAKQRWRVVQAYRAARTTAPSEAQAARQTAEQCGCSASTVRNYYRLWKTAGKAGLIPVIRARDTRPKTPWAVIQLIILLRRTLHWGGDRIAAELKQRGIYRISHQGVYNLFKRYRLWTRTYHPVGVRTGIAYRRRDVEAVNEVWHLDFAGPFVASNGQKCWVLVGVDAYSRLLLTLTVVRSLNTRTICEHLEEVFAEYGTPQTIVTDNGGTFASVWQDGAHPFTECLTRHGIAHQRIAPYYPEANGKAEAAVKIVKREAIKPLCTTKPDWNPGQLQQVLTQFQTSYNHHRLHGGIGWQTPAQRWFTKGAETPKGLDHLFFFTQPDLHLEFC